MPLPTLHLFNPSHDEALAAGYPFYYPSTIARQLAVEWAMLPALTAEPGDWVWLPEGAELPETSRAHWLSGVRFVKGRKLNEHFWARERVGRIEPWGWDPLLRHQLSKTGVPASLLPTDEALSRLRALSSRETTAFVLSRLLGAPALQGFGLTGQSVVARSEAEVERCLAQWGGAMVKSLWSCSGRGVFCVRETPTASDRGRWNRLLREQGGVELEPVQQGQLDFALEFRATARGRVEYLGASLFRTGSQGAYMGNVVAPQAAIMQEIAAAFPLYPKLHALLVETLEEVLASRLDGHYAGPLGVDLMVCKSPAGPTLLPCVEVNLRKTMGHVSMKVAQREIKPSDIPSALRKLRYYCAPSCHTREDWASGH